MPGVPLLAGGKSMGGRMTSLAVSEDPLPGVRGLASLHVLQGADHSFRVLASSGRSKEQILDEMGEAISGWIETIVPAS